VLGAAITLVAMEYFLFGTDKSYAFIVYSRSDLLKGNQAKPVEVTPA